MSREALKIKAIRLYDEGMRMTDVCAEINRLFPKADVPYSTVKTWCTRYREEILALPPVRDTINEHMEDTKPPFIESGGSFLPERGINMVVWPDPQVKPNIDLGYCQRVGRYVAHKKPDVFLCGGDFADMPSLSTYEQAGSKGMEGARYKEDILSVQRALKLLMTPIRDEMARDPSWKPRFVMLLGNHEDRIRRAIEATPKLDGVIGMCDLQYEEYGFEVIPFLKEIVIGGMAFSHFFCSGVMGRPITTARALIAKKHMSCFAFHQQGRDIAFGQRGDGKQITAIIAGSGYEHNEGYLNHQTNNHWRGLYNLYDLIEGECEENAVSMKYLRREYP